MRNESFWKWKLPVITMVAEVVVLILTALLAFYCGPGFTTWLLKNGSLDDMVSGLLIMPALLMDFVMFCVAIVVYPVVIFGGLGWSIPFHYVNKEKGILLCLVAELPGIIMSVVVIVMIIDMCIEFRMIAIFVYAVPLIPTLAECVAQIVHICKGVKVKKDETFC